MWQKINFCVIPCCRNYMKTWRNGLEKPQSWVEFQRKYTKKIRDSMSGHGLQANVIIKLFFKYFLYLPSISWTEYLHVQIVFNSFALLIELYLIHRYLVMWETPRLWTLYWRTTFANFATLVYLAREKRPQYHHNFKVGAINALIKLQFISTCKMLDQATIQFYFS